jgi:diguanylate cyclase (GGDEF)-like protein
MNKLSFRNRLLILLIGLVVGAQIVTLFTALGKTEETERNRASRELVAGAKTALLQLKRSERQLANTVAVLTGDFALKDLIATRIHDAAAVDEQTVASALANHGERIGADLTLALDTEGKLIASAENTAQLEPELIAAVAAAELPDADGPGSSAGSAQFVVTSSGVHQVFTSALDEIGRIAVGFTVNDKLAKELQELAGVHVAFLHGEGAARRVVASTVDGLRDGSFALGTELRDKPEVASVGGEDYLATVTHLASNGPSLDLALLKPMQEVMAPFRELEGVLLKYIGITLAAAIIAAIYLGRSAARPVQQLAAGAMRVASGDYSEEVKGAGGLELANLAQAFNTMQSGIAERESRLLHQARHDGITGLPNRLHAEEWLLRRLTTLAQGEQFGLVLLAVTNLQEISASLGFDIAGELVRHLAKSLGESGDGKNLVALVDATHFVVAAPLSSNNGVDSLLRELRERASRPLTTAGIRLQAAVVLGAALAPQHGGNANELLRCAEAALETAIQQRQPQALFEHASDEAQRRALQLGADLPQALQSGQLYMQYQPKFRMSDRSPRGVEALVRWDHSEFGKVSPAEFVPIVERTGNSGLLTRWVLHQALTQLGAWQRQGINVDLAVNLSAADIVDPGMLEFILGALHDAKLATSALTLEITESVLLNEPELARHNMELLRVAGVRFSIDDFGTGYSSLSQLRELPADELKIDQSFVRVLGQGGEHLAVIRAIVDLAHGLGLRTVAEGVEDEAQWRMLAELGCDAVQGYLTGRPQSVEQLTPQLRAAMANDIEAVPTASLRVLELRRRE